jgi:hypothetical protein
MAAAGCSRSFEPALLLLGMEGEPNQPSAISRYCRFRSTSLAVNARVLRSSARLRYSAALSDMQHSPLQRRTSEMRDLFQVKGSAGNGGAWKPVRIVME